MRLRNLPMRSLSQSLRPEILRTEYLLTYLPKPSQLEKKVLLCCWVGMDDKAPCWAGATKNNTS